MDNPILNDSRNNNSNNNSNNSPTTAHSLLTQLGNSNTRVSPFFSLLRLTSQANLQDLLNGTFNEGSGSGGIGSNTNTNSGSGGHMTTTINSGAAYNNSNSNINNGLTIHPSEINDLLTHSILSNFPTTSSISKGVLGNATFFETHHRAVKGIDFSPTHMEIFCSAGLDGKCNIYDARFGKLKSSSIISYQGTVNFSGLKFLNCGNKIALSTSSNKLLIFDIEKAAVVQSFDRCCFSGPFKTSIAMDPNNCNILTTPNLNGKGLSQIDIRSSTPIKNIDQVHTNTINDIQILNQQWSRYYSGSGSSNLILTASSDSTAKIYDSQTKNTVKQFDFSSSQNSITVTPESPPTNNSSCLLVGGDRLSVFQVDGTLSNVFFIPQCKSIMKLHYNNNGTKLFLSSSDGCLKLLNRSNLKHDILGTVYKHSRDIQDLAISKNDEYLVTASTDSKVGLIRIGEPIFGPTEYGEVI